MKTIILIATCFFMLLACSKDEGDAENYRNGSISWMIGADHKLDTSVVVPVSNSIDASILVESSSICPNADLMITATSENEILLDTVYHDGDGSYIIPGSKGRPLNIHSRIVDNGSLILCVWIGQARIKYNYVE